MLEIKNLKFSYNKKNRDIFNGLGIKFVKGFNVVLGPNGAGKSTLIKLIFGLIDCEGEIFYGSKNLKEMIIDEKIELMSYLPQMDLDLSNLTVLEMVMLGRLPDLRTKISDKDLEIVMETLRALNIEDLAMNKFSYLSGGQKKLIFIAQTLVKYPKILLLDEPTNSLDLQKQLELCYLLKKLVRDRDLDLIVILHDINLAARYADNVVVLTSEGKVYSVGEAKDVITEEMIEEVYGVIASVNLDMDNKPVVSAKKSIRD